MLSIKFFQNSDYKIISLAHSHAVLTPPEYVASEGQPNVTFQCTATGPGLDPGLYATADDQNDLSDRGIKLSKTVRLNATTLQLNITISAILDNKNTTLQCYGTRNNRSESFISNDATFMVQG